MRMWSDSLGFWYESSKECDKKRSIKFVNLINVPNDGPL